MRKTLGDYNIEKSSSSDVNNISWSHKNLMKIKNLKRKKLLKKVKFHQEQILFIKKLKMKK